MSDDTRWDHALKVTSDGGGLAGQAGAVLLRKLADRPGQKTHRHPPETREPDTTAEDRRKTISNQPASPLNHRG
jgi:hypothetical protein